MRIAVITGASMGLGREFARQIPKCYRSLDEIWLIARNTDKLEEVKQELTSVNGVYCRLYNSDLLQDEVYNHLQRDMEALKPDIRILVNAAGFGKNASVMATDRWEDTYRYDPAELSGTDTADKPVYSFHVRRKPYCKSCFGGSFRPAAGSCCVCSDKGICIKLQPGFGQGTCRERDFCDGRVPWTGRYEFL